MLYFTEGGTMGADYVTAELKQSASPGESRSKHFSKQTKNRKRNSIKLLTNIYFIVFIVHSIMYFICEVL